MKARIKATGKIVEVAYHGLGVYVDMNQWDKEYQFDEIIVLDNGDPDYWERLKNQYAGMAMQGLLSNERCWEENADKIAEVAICYAKELVKGLRIERSN